MKTFIRTCGNLSTTAVNPESGKRLGSKVSAAVYADGDRRYLRLEGVRYRFPDLLLTDAQREKLFTLQGSDEAAYAFDLLNVQTIFNEQ